MLSRSLRLALAAVLALLANAAYATSEHAHDGNGHAHEMRLDDGQKWRTDEAARKGMSEIRSAVAAALPQVGQGRYDRASFATLADRVQAQVDYMLTNCRLSEAADAQFHLALDQILDGVATMKDESGQARGVVEILAALDQYRNHFDHPGWEPLEHSASAGH